MFYTQLNEEDIFEFFKRQGYDVSIAKMDTATVMNNRFFLLKVKQKNKIFRKKIKGFANDMSLNIFNEEGFIQNHQFSLEWATFMLEKFGEDYFNFHKTRTEQLIAAEQENMENSTNSKPAILERIKQLESTHKILSKIYNQMKQQTSTDTL